MAALWMLWALTGGAVATAIMIRIWLRDPPHGVMRNYFGILIAGVVGGLVGGGLVTTLAGSNPMPGLAVVGAIAGGVIAAGGVAMLAGGAGKAAH